MSRADADQLHQEIAALRDDIGGAFDELDRRRRELLDLPRQLQKHAVPIAVAAAVASVSLITAAALTAAQRRRAARPIARARRTGHVARLLLQHPERIERPAEPVLMRIAGAALAAAASVAVRSAAQRLLAARPAPLLPPAERLDLQ